MRSVRDTILFNEYSNEFSLKCTQPACRYIKIVLMGLSSKCNPFFRWWANQFFCKMFSDHIRSSKIVISRECENHHNSSILHILENLFFLNSEPPIRPPAKYRKSVYSVYREGNIRPVF